MLTCPTESRLSRRPAAGLGKAGTSITNTPRTLELPILCTYNSTRKGTIMKSYISRMTLAVLLGIFMLPPLTPSAQPQTRPWWFYGCPKGVVAQIPGDVPGPGSKGWTEYQSCLQQNLGVSAQQSAQIAPILANEGQKIIATRSNNSLSDSQKRQEVKSLQAQSDSQLKAILSSAQYDKLQTVRYQALRWVTQKRLGWQ